MFLSRILATALLGASIGLIPFTARADASAPPKTQIESYPGSPTLNAHIETARQDALEILNQASMKSPNSSFLQMATRLQNIVILYPPEGRTFVDCHQFNGRYSSERFKDAFVKNFTYPNEPMQMDDRIYICAEGMGKSNAVLAQILIHEINHVLGDADECSTTRKELSVYVGAEKRLAFKSSYYLPEECNIQVPAELKP